MRSTAALALLIAAGCAPPPPPPPAAPVVVAAPEPSVAPEPPPKEGPPVLVPQRMTREAREVDLSPSGKLVALASFDGLHVVDVESGQTRGVLAGCADDHAFTIDGDAIVVTCRDKKLARVWDLATDTAREVALPSSPRRLLGPFPGGRVVIGGEGRIDVIEARRAAVVTLETGARYEVTNVEIAESGVIVATDHEAATVWSAAGKLVRRVAKARTSTAYSLAASGTRLALADTAGATVVDVQTGKSAARITPCGEASIEDIEWTADEDAFVVACAAHGRSPARVIVATPEGTEVHELLQADRGGFVVRPHDARVAVIHDTVGVAVFELASGRELHRLTPPTRAAHRPRVSRDLDRALFRLGNHAAGVVVIDRARGPIGPQLRPDAYPLGLGRVGDLLFFRGPSGTVYVDPVNDEIIRDLPSELSPDGVSYARPTGPEGVEIVDRRTKDRRLSHTPKGAAPLTPMFSAHGAWLAIPEVVPKGKETDHRLRLVDPKTAKDGKSFPLGPVVQPWAWSEDDGLIAVHAVAARRRDGKPCAQGADPACAVVRIFDARSARPLATISPSATDLQTLAFLPGNKQLLVGEEVFDARSGKLLWTLTRWAPYALVPGHGVVLRSGGDDYTLLDAATGKAARQIPALGVIHAVTRTGAFLLASHAGHAVVWETATWTPRVTTLALSSTKGAILSEDARLVHTIDGGDLVTYRLSDGRSIRRALPGLDFVITDEGVFDPIHAASGAFLVRLGPDVTRSAMGPLSRIADRLGHPGLYADFIAGKPVGPRLAVKP